MFEAHAPYVGRCLRHLGVADAELDDALQEVFMVVHRRMHELGPDPSMRSWLYAISLRIARAHRRRAARRRDRPVDEMPEPVSESEARRVDARDAARALLAALDDDKRAVFVLYHVEQMSMREVAEVVGCPLQTAYSRLKAAQRVLQREIAERRRRGEAWP
ncbi:MAG TPA: RNA polymerase sigma factor [Sandaracinaceae bacterium LLY-WYZ-13_1]|nr:RNA polymerase sigma factor [Sandaracinaceae bacterium LLY-WYZ-13_1]